MLKRGKKVDAFLPQSCYKVGSLIKNTCYVVNILFKQMHIGVIIDFYRGMPQQLANDLYIHVIAE